MGVEDVSGLLFDGPDDNVVRRVDGAHRVDADIINVTTNGGNIILHNIFI